MKLREPNLELGGLRLWRVAPRGGFTLIEVMVAVAIMAITMTIGIPLAYQALRKNDLARAVRDTMEGLKAARDRAVMHATPYEFVIRDTGEVDVVPASGPKVDAQSGPAPMMKGVEDEMEATFPRKFGDDVKIESIDLNFQPLMQDQEVRVRFSPRGTCSHEFTVVLGYGSKQRVITVDIVTGIPEEITPQ